MFLLGNPLIWWTNLAVLLVTLLCWVVGLVAAQRTGRGRESPGGELLLAWATHFLPFLLVITGDPDLHLIGCCEQVTRPLYVHHYYPALMFSSLHTAVRIHQHPLPSLPFLLILLSSCSFFLFSPLCYGMTGELASSSNSTLHHLHWLSSWQF